MLQLVRLIAFLALAVVGFIRLPRANVTAQWFGAKYHGSRIQPNVTILHTTEGTDWPAYEGGATAPHVTAKPNLARKRLEFRQHFALDVSARALRNEPGGVETNTLNAVQFELVGTCDPATHARWRRAKFRHIYWPKAPAWALRDLGEALAELHAQFPDFPLQDAAPRGWLPYPASYGSARGQRLTMSEWRNAYGVLGHQHVPENVHGDPGSIDIDRILEFAGIQKDPPAELTRGGRVDAVEVLLVKARRAAIAGGYKHREKALSALLRGLRKSIHAHPKK